MSRSNALAATIGGWALTLRHTDKRWKPVAYALAYGAAPSRALRLLAR